MGNFSLRCLTGISLPHRVDAQRAARARFAIHRASTDIVFHTRSVADTVRTRDTIGRAKSDFSFRPASCNTASSHGDSVRRNRSNGRFHQSFRVGHGHVVSSTGRRSRLSADSVPLLDRNTACHMCAVDASGVGHRVRRGSSQYRDHSPSNPRKDISTLE